MIQDFFTDYNGFRRVSDFPAEKILPSKHQSTKLHRKRFCGIWDFVAGKDTELHPP